MKTSDTSKSIQEVDFHHPFQPYEIQQQFMNAVYDCLENGKVGILESPTGTGKSLSLICGSMTWLRDFRGRMFNESLNNDVKDINEPDWVIENARKQKLDNARRRRHDQEARLAKVREAEVQAKIQFESGEPQRKRQKVAAGPSTTDDEDAEFLLRDYDSDDQNKISKKSQNPSAPGLSAETQILMGKLGFLERSREELDDESDYQVKIFFCSRTHSQLSQFANEMRRVRMPPSISLSDPEQQSQEKELVDDLKHVTLGSRKQLCINSQVNKLGSATAINERCLELQQSGTPQASRCTYLPNKDNEVLVNDYRDYALAKIRDIEDFGILGKKIGICPYYASRAAVKPTEIVTLPYPLLLQKSAREALNLSLKGHVIVIDEAHNLMDAISNIHSTSVSLADLTQSRAQLEIYLKRFRNKLKGKNRVYVTQLVRVIDSLTTYLQSNSSSSSAHEIQVNTSDLLAGKGVDQINLHKLIRYLQDSKLARKVERYLHHKEEQSLQQPQVDNNQSSMSKRLATIPALTNVQSFLMTLANPAIEGRFFYKKEPSDQSTETAVCLRYLLLEPTNHFKEIVDDARAVILAGGTMAPMSDYTNHLFHYLPLDRIETLSCGHIIPASNLVVFTASRGSHGIELDFTFEKRNSEAMINELGLAILEISTAVPDGIVVFFPSYAYLDTAIRSWQRASDSMKPQSTIWSQISVQKRIFLEPKSTSASNASHNSSTAANSSSGSPIDKLLTEYATHIHSNESTGGLLFAVIGGSLSEGINFSDRLGRGIVVVGLPFPNLQSAEWKAKMEFVARRSRGKKESADAPREYYENACMRAVNQSVGRAIRHKDDYAAIVLLDRRYERESIRGKLPAWIRRSLGKSVGFANAVREIEGFFANKKQ